MSRNKKGRREKPQGSLRPINGGASNTTTPSSSDAPAPAAAPSGRLRRVIRAEDAQAIGIELVASTHERSRIANDAPDTDKLGPGVMKLRGRPLKDGGRRGRQGIQRRMTVHLPIELADAIEARCFEWRLTYSDAVCEAVAHFYGIDLASVRK